MSQILVKNREFFYIKFYLAPSLTATPPELRHAICRQNTRILLLLLVLLLLKEYFLSAVQLKQNF